MSTLFLNDDELVDLTGYRQPSKQIGQLKAQRIPFHTNRAGHPKVARAVVETFRQQLARQRRAAELTAKFKSENRQSREAMRKQKPKARALKSLPVFHPRRAISPSSRIRRERMRLRTPSWANQDAIRAVYAEAKRLTAETGIEHHVDHEIPLAGRRVSGLHVHTNLRCLPAEVNRSKHNSFYLPEA